MNIDWFKDWFDSDYYQLVYNHRDENDAKQICDLIVKSITLGKNAKVLDAACGAGRHYIEFVEKGFSVIGFDLSKNLLSKAKRNLESKNLPINLFCADIRKVCLKEKFDLITNLFTSFGYFENDDENFEFIEKSYEMLKDDGYYVLDYINVYFLVKKLIPYSEKVIDNYKIIEQRKIVNNRVNKKIIISDIQTSKVVSEFYESVKLYKPEFLISNITSFGFRLKHYFGSYNGDTFVENNSQRLILIFQK